MTLAIVRWDAMLEIVLMIISVSLTLGRSAVSALLPDTRLRRPIFT
jgi:hypothetical protein